LARFEFFAEVGFARAKFANAFIDIVVEPLEEPRVRRCGHGHASEDQKKFSHRGANYLSAVRADTRGELKRR
jgi:hypothetical protein